ncbi:pumilio and CPL domain-containing protein penguin [Dermacentor variabilis]|uniref:pumilio and CPL domain-containing protein penguin n=1 Tax=Dermacentor variabilis TaxID=34621 RepID=UPI003F5BB3D6
MKAKKGSFSISTAPPKLSGVTKMPKQKRTASGLSPAKTSEPGDVKGKYAKANSRKIFPPTAGKPGKLGRAKRKKSATSEALSKVADEEKATEQQAPRPQKRGAEGNNDDASEPKKIKLVEMKKKQRKQERKKHESKFYEISKAAKRIWEDLRLKSCTAVRREELLAQLTKVVKGNIKQLIFAHDTSRVIECMEHLGTAVHRNMIFEEVKDIIVPMTKSKYAKFMVRQILRNGTAEQKQHVIKAFSTQVVSLLHHVDAAAILEVIYNEHANAFQRSLLLQEFYSRDLALFKKDRVITFADALAESTDPAKMIENLKETLMKIIDKPVVRHSIIHHVMLEFFKSADANSKSEMIRALAGSLVEMVHTKDGARVAMQCIWHGTAKDRKTVIKSFKTYVAKIAREEYGHMVLLSIFDCVDDTKLVEGVVIAELLKEPVELLMDPHGQRVLAYLVAPRDARIFHPQVVDILKEGDISSTSKKDPKVRKQELRKMPASVLGHMIADNAEELLTCGGPTSIALHVILTSLSTSEAAVAFKTIAKLLNASPYKIGKEQESSHLFDQGSARFFLKKMATHDKDIGDEGQDSFCGVIADEVSEETMSTWIGCNFGAFFLVQLLETGITKGIERVKSALEGKHNTLKKCDSKGAVILRKKLQDL